MAKLSYRIGREGVAALAYDGRSLLPDESKGALRVEEGAAARAAPVPGAREVLLRCAWGAVRAAYSARGDHLRIALSVHNDTGNTLADLSLRVLEPEFPQAPLCAELDAGQFGLGGAPHPLAAGPVAADPRAAPPVLFLAYGSGALAFCSEDPAAPAALRVSGATNPPDNTRAALQVLPGPLGPGKTLRCTVSLRFGPPGATIGSLAGDVLRRWTAAYPFQIRWSDRRPIGELFLATSAQPHPASNPRGWFNNAADVDVTSPQGRARFRARLLRYAEESIGILKAMNAQGMVTWDPEGQEFAGAAYYGDPRLAGRLAPEAGLEEYFQRFRDAGLRVGVCVRPQEIRFVHGAPRQEDSPDPARTLLRKIDFARRRWGCTLFYVDSTVRNEAPLDAEVFRRVAAANPDVLLMPENENLRYFAYGAPLNSFQHHTVVSTPPGARAVYPRAFSVLLAGEGDVGAHRLEFAAAVRRGDILLFHGWWPNPNNAVIKSIYHQAHS